MTKAKIKDPYKNTFRKSLKEYLRELSIIVVGVFVTLLITNLITSSTRQKEISQMLEFIKIELLENLADLKHNQFRWEGEQRIFKSIIDSNNDLKKISADTLAKYNYAIGAIYNLSIKSESYELLKSSVLIQYVKDKNLLRELSRTYSSLKNLSAQLSSYSSQKRTIFAEPVMAEMNENDFEKLVNGDPAAPFYMVVNKPEFQKFIRVGQTILSPNSIFKDCIEEIQETILSIDTK